MTRWSRTLINTVLDFRSFANLAFLRFKKSIGVVPQDDVVLPELTVRENIMHSAQVRLPRSWTSSEIASHVDLLLRCLGLWAVRDNLVGDVIKPRISGGQRKRVSIGIELAAAPMCLVLDEPTSGLDSTSALSIVQMLRELTHLGITVVCIIHQPRTEIFDSIDQLMLLSQGSQVYVGPADAATSHFQQLGFHLPARCNPADAIIDIVAGQGVKYLIADEGVAATSTRSDGTIESLIQGWKKISAPSKKDLTSKSVAVSLTPSVTPTDTLLVKTSSRRGASWLRQFWLCFVRALRQQSRQTLSLMLELKVSSTAGLLIGLCVYNYKGRLFQGVYQGTFGLLSSTSNTSLVPQLGMFCSLAIGEHSACIKLLRHN